MNSFPCMAADLFDRYSVLDDFCAQPLCLILQLIHGFPSILPLNQIIHFILNTIIIFRKSWENVVLGRDRYSHLFCLQFGPKWCISFYIIFFFKAVGLKHSMCNRLMWSDFTYAGFVQDWYSYAKDLNYASVIFEY